MFFYKLFPSGVRMFSLSLVMHNNELPNKCFILIYDSI